MKFDDKIRVVEDFPKEGISFKDITTLLKDGEAYREAVNQCVDLVKDIDYVKIIGPEARGFIFASPMSYATGKGFVPVRKPGKLPAETLTHEYQLEYGTDILEIHRDAIKPGEKVIVVDDLLATGGTIKAVIDMVEQLGGQVVAAVFLIELEFLNGREKVGQIPVYSVMKYR